MGELNLQNQGPRKKPPPNFNDGPKQFWRTMVFVGIFFVMLWIVNRMNLQGVPGEESPAQAVQKPEPRMPPTVFDDELSVVKIAPSRSWATSEQLIDEMIFAKSQWQTKNPSKHIVACDHFRERVDDYGFCWILHYERR